MMKIRERIPSSTTSKVIGVTTKTIDRLLKDPESGFPPPHYLTPGGRRMWFLDEVIEWTERRMAAAAAAGRGAAIARAKKAHAARRVKAPQQSTPAA